MRKKPWHHLLAGLLVISLNGLLQAQETTDDKSRDSDRAAIRKSGHEFVEAFDRGDAKAAASSWTDHGEYHDDSGAVIRGRTALESSYAEFFKEQAGATIKMDVKSIRFPSRDTAIEEGVIIVTPGDTQLPKSTRYSVLHVREDGHWKIAFAREWGTGIDELRDLDWLVGEWVAKAEDREVRVHFKWNANKTRLRNDVTTSVDGKPVSTGVQMIGMDPQTRLLTSWMFPDDGGMAQAVWTSDGDRWLADAVGTTPDGSETTATNIIARTDNDEFTWQSTNRTVNGEPVPDTPPVKVKRVKK